MSDEAMITAAARFFEDHGDRGNVLYVADTQVLAAIAVRRIAENVVGARPDYSSAGFERASHTFPRGGTIRGVGVGGMICGFGAALTIIDLGYGHKHNREQLGEWLRGVVFTRMEPDGHLLITATTLGYL